MDDEGIFVLQEAGEVLVVNEVGAFIVEKLEAAHSVDEVVAAITERYAVDPERAGTAFGFFNLMTGVCLLGASTLAGLLWESVGASATFYAGASFSAVAMLGLLLYRR